MRPLATRHLREWALLLLLLMAALVGAVRGGWFDRLDYGFYDSSMAASGRPASEALLILAIDEPSLARLGRWPWSRQRLAEIVERLADARSGPVLLDVILSEPQQDDPAADARLAAAIARHGAIVLPVFMPSPLQPAVLPLPVFAAHARLGHAQALVDGDGVNRRYLVQEIADGRAYPHVSAVLRQRSDTSDTAQPDRVARLVPFAGPAGHFQRLSVVDLLTGGVDPAQLRGRTVLVGATATGLGDNLVTPLAGSGGTMPGVEFVANIVDGLAAGLEPRVVTPLPRLALSALVLVLLMGALLVTSPRAALLLSVGTMVACAALAWLALRLTGWWWPPAAPVLLVALAYPLWSWRRLEASLSTMARETTRIAALVHPQLPKPATPAPVAGFLDPVESRIAAISGAVDRIADAVLVGTGADPDGRYREEMMRHLAHDLRSPLVSLRSLAEQLRSGGGTVDAATLGRIDACARRSLDLTEQFLLLGRAQALDASRFAEIDLVQLLHQTADDLWEDAQREGSRIARVCTLDIALVRGDARLLQRAWMNLGWNALRHGPRGGTVTLSLQADGTAGYVFGVHDTGAGFPPDQLPAMAQAYAQGAPATQGFGLGLALVCLVADKHKARIVATQAPEGGFSIHLHILYT